MPFADPELERDWDEEKFKANPEDWFRKVYDLKVKKWESKPFDPELGCKPLSYDEKKGGMPPKMYETICRTSPDHWSLGSLMTCEKIDDGHDAPSDAVCQWVDDEFTYCLRRRAAPKTDRTVEGDPDSDRFFKKDISSVWTLSPNVFCKVMWWTEESTTDATTIRFINENIPSIPTQEIIHDWIDPEWRRSFLLTKRAPGMRYDEAWEYLWEEQKIQVAAQVAKHFKSLAEYTSDYIETVVGKGIEGKHSLRLREDLPEWKPRIEPKVSREQYREFLKRVNGHEPPNLGERFILQHLDLNPTNFFVTFPSEKDEAPELTAIIDWSNVGYYPEFYAATLPRGRYHFAIEDQEGGWDWMAMLSNALVKEGFTLEMDYLTQTVPEWSICRYDLPN